MFLLFITKYAERSSVICSVAPFNYKIHKNYIYYLDSILQKNKLLCLIKINMFGKFRGVFDVYFENCTKYTNTLCGQNAVFFSCAAVCFIPMTT